MKRIFIVLEGETEERFLRRVLYTPFINNEKHIEAQQWITNRKLGTTGNIKGIFKKDLKARSYESVFCLQIHRYPIQKAHGHIRSAWYRRKAGRPVSRWGD